MDPYHITEFASPRYFSKLDQQHGDPSAQEALPNTTLNGPSRPLEQSKFALPLRFSSSATPHQQTSDQLRPTEKRHEKRARFLFLSKKSAPGETGERTSSSLALARRPPFNHLFFSLPSELQVQIISSLPLSDILNLRLVSKTWHELITVNEAPIARIHIDYHIPAFATRLYPLPSNTSPDFHYLCSLWHRLHVAAKLAHLICEWITKDIFLRRTEAERLDFEPKYESMRRRLIPLVFTIFHFFEMYRKDHVQYILNNDGHGLLHTPYTLNPIELNIMKQYDEKTLLRVHEIFPLVVSSFCRRLRPPSYVGRVERSLRGYLKEKPPDEVHAATLCLGGLRQVEKFWEIKGYNIRRGAVDSWYSGLSREPVETDTKSRRGFMGLGRRKQSIPNGGDSHSRSSFEGRPTSQGKQLKRHSKESDHLTNLVYQTSLSAGMPMAPLPKEHLRLVLPDLPALQQIWLVTAEALILERKIVERPQDIRRNAQVMLELIREDVAAEEEEWWYGRGSPESLKLPREATEDDPLEF